MWSIWLVFCDSGFHSVCHHMDKDKKIPYRRHWLLGKLGLVLMAGAMLSKSLIQFSVDRQGCVPSLFDLRPNYGGGDVENVNLLQNVLCMHCHTVTLRAPDPAAGLLQPTPPLETPGHSEASLGQSLVGSLLLSSGSWCAKCFVCALQESVSLVLCNFWPLYGGVMAISSKRAYITPRSTESRAPAPVAGHCWSVPPQETLKPRSGSVSAGSLGPGAQGLFEPPKCLWWVWGLILNAISPLLPPCWGFSFAQRCGVSFLGGLQHSPVNSCSAQVVIFEFSQEMSTPPSTPPSCQ